MHNTGGTRCSHHYDISVRFTADQATHFNHRSITHYHCTLIIINICSFHAVLQQTNSVKNPMNKLQGERKSKPVNKLHSKEIWTQVCQDVQSFTLFLFFGNSGVSNKSKFHLKQVYPTMIAYSTALKSYLNIFHLADLIFNLRFYRTLNFILTLPMSKCKNPKKKNHQEAHGPHCSPEEQ